jgi:hypothetical protein
MPYYITKTGLDAFDAARAWGLAVVLNVLTEDEVEIRDVEWAFVVDSAVPLPNNLAIANNLAWRTLTFEQNWQRVFVTQKGDWLNKRDEALSVIADQLTTLLAKYLFSESGDLKRGLKCILQNPANTVVFGKGESLPGGLDPTGFKGLRHNTRAQYREGQLNVPEDHWALACLGMVTCGTYRYAREAGQSSWLVLLPIPQEIHFSYFRDVQTLFRLPGLMYHGVQNAAAHYAVQLAERLRRRAAAQGSLQDRYSAILYFKLFGAGQQMKPAQGNQLRLEPLMEAIARDPHGTQPMLEWLDYCFCLGATKGAEDLALAATELVMRWDLEAYDRLVRVAVRILGREQVRKKNPRDFDSFLRRTRTEAIQQAMEVMSHAVV